MCLPCTYLLGGGGILLEPQRPTMARALGCPLLSPSSGPPFASALGDLDAEAYAAHLRFGPWSRSWLSKCWWKGEACSDSWGVTRAPPRPGSSRGLILFVAPSLSGMPLSLAAWNPGCQVRCRGGGSEGGPVSTGVQLWGLPTACPSLLPPHARRALCRAGVC